MPTIIDSLVVELGFDTQGLEAGRKKVEDAFKRTGQAGAKAGKDIENSAKTAADFLNRLRNNVLSLFAAFTAGRGIKDFVSGMTTTDAALGRFSKTVGMSAKEVATWRAAGSLMGVDAKDIDATFSGLTQQFQQFALTGDSAVVPYFRSLGIAMSDVTTGKMRPMNDLLMELSKRVQGMDPTRAVAIMNGMAIPAGMQNMILKGPDAIKKMLDAQKALAEAQARDAPAAERRQAAWNGFLNQATAVGTVILETLTPAIIALTDAAKAFAEWGERHPELVGAAFAALTGLVLALSGAIVVNLVAGAIASAAAGFGVLLNLAAGMGLQLAILTETALPALSEAFLGLGIAIEATPIGWIITGIAAISVAGYELYKHWDSIAKWWRELWGGMSEDADEGSDKITDDAAKIRGGKSDGTAAPVAKAPGGAGGAGGAARGKGPTYGDNKGMGEEDVAAFTRMGWSREQAVGIVANIAAESNGQIDNVGDNGTAYGLAQWHADRQANFKAWAKKDIRQSTRPEQLAFINYELRSGTEKQAGAVLAKTATAEHAARAVSTYYERPKDIDGANATRAAIANAMQPAAAGAPVAPQVAAKPSGAPAPHVAVKTGAPPAPVASKTPLSATRVAVNIALQRAAPAAAPSITTMAATAAGAARGGNYNHQTSETRIGEVKVYTQATDAAGIAKDLKPAMQRDTFAQQAQQGQT